MNPYRDSGNRNSGNRPSERRSTGSRNPAGRNSRNREYERPDTRYRSTNAPRRRPAQREYERRDTQRGYERRDTQRGTYQNIQRRQNQRMSLIIIAVFLVVILLVVLLIKPSHKEEKVVEEESSSIPESVPEVEEPEEPAVPTMKGLEGVDQNAAQISNYYTYGTYFNMNGSMASIVDIQSVQLALRSLNEATDVYTFELEWSLENSQVSFKTGTPITAGVNLEALPPGQYAWLIRAVSGDGTVVYRTMQEPGSLDPIDYYTLTRNGINYHILMNNATDMLHSMPYFAVTIQEEELPEDVYDFAIDPGHGGNDGGCSMEGHTEAEIVLDIALKLKTDLEAMGYKVFLTRDGTEDPSTPMAFTMYDPDGRVNTACASRSKFCVSLHLNSVEAHMDVGGLQVYSTARGTYELATLFAQNIKETSGCDYSTMNYYKAADGVYFRTSRDYRSDDLMSNSDELFMIRELGGIATGAYMDGSNPTYGTNLYRNSHQGVQTFLTELGYITVEKDYKSFIEHPDLYAQGIANGLNAITQQLGGNAPA